MQVRKVRGSFFIIGIVGCSGGGGSDEEEDSPFVPIDPSVPVGEPVSVNPLLGTWYNTDASGEVGTGETWTFLGDGTYLYIDNSGIEWGTFSNIEATGELITTQSVDQSDTGLTTTVAQNGNVFFNVSDSDLSVVIDENGDGVTDFQSGYQRVVDTEYAGTWLSTATMSDLELLIVFDKNFSTSDGGFSGRLRAVHVYIDGNVEPFDWEEGNIRRRIYDGSTTFTVWNDDFTGSVNEIGMSRFRPGHENPTSKLFTEWDGDILTFSIDEDSSGNVDSSVVFERQ